MPSSAPGSLLDGLIQEVRNAHGAHGQDTDRAQAIALALQPFLGDPRLLDAEQREPGSQSYRQHVLYVDPSGAFSIVSLVWSPGQGTSVHDHVAWCVIGVHEGLEREISYRLVETGTDRFLEPLTESLAGVGEVSWLTPPGDIHRVENGGREPAISIHVYGLDIRPVGTSIRRRYELPTREPQDATAVPPATRSRFLQPSSRR
jgi:3-mercaptopropionate dioxygenase